MPAGYESELLAVTIGHHRQPDRPPETGARPSIAAVNAYRRTGQPPVVPLIVSEEIDWASYGLEPRWIGQDSTDAVAALAPNIFTGRGAQEWKRFVAGVRERGELALSVAMVGSLAEDAPLTRNVFEPSASVDIPGGGFSSVGGPEVSLARRPTLAEGLGRADRDLALQILNSRPVELPWWSLQLSGSTVYSTSGEEQHAPEGFLHPLLVSGAGEVVAAVWESASGDVRFYVLPALESWTLVLRWLSTTAVPEFVPSAVRRLRSRLADDAEFATAAETVLSERLHQLDHEYEVRRGELVDQLAAAREEADGIRDPLLFGSSKALERAVGRVLIDAGLTVVFLDDLIGTASADLLVTDQRGRVVLVEVKSAAGNAKEALIEVLKRHLQTWPELRGHLPVVDGGVLVVNHETSRPPGDRSPRTYNRQAFTKTSTVPVVTSLDLFRWWRDGDRMSIGAAVFSGVEGVTALTQEPSQRRGVDERRRRMGFRRR